MNSFKLLRMDKETNLHNLETIQEMILDEQKLLTYTLISRELCIHVNASKSLLGKVVQNIRNKMPKTDLNVNYIICGLCETNKGRTTVCLESEIATVRKTFRTIFFEHIYSVCKGVPKFDNVALTNLNKFDDIPLCVGLIKSSKCDKRTAEEINSMKTNSQPFTIVAKPIKSLSAPIKKVKEEIKTENFVSNMSVDKAKLAKSEPIVKSEIMSPKKQSSVDKLKSSSKIKNQKGIAGFFGKQSVISCKKPTEVPVVDKEQTPNGSLDEQPTQKFIKEEKIEAHDICPKPFTNEENVLETSIGKGQSKNNKVSNVKKNTKLDKKRKRVLKVSDSESDDDKDPFVNDTPNINHESDDEIPPTPTINTVKITSGILNPKKRRKIVDKTYTDEDGYILTKKEEVYESCSDENEVDMKENLQASNQVKKEQVKIEISPEKTKKESKSSKKKISPPQKGKQATMMNFFKKV